MSNPKKLIVPTVAPRNPFVVAAKRRHAGSHRPSQKVERQQHARELHQQLKKTRSPVDDNGASLSDSLHLTPQMLENSTDQRSHAWHNNTCLALIFATTVFV